MPLVIAALALAFLVHPSDARADPIRVTGGSLTFDTGDPPAFSLSTSSGQLFEAEGFRVNWQASCFYQCPSGAVIPLSISPSESGEPVFFRADGVDFVPIMNLIISAPEVTVGSETGTREGPFEVFRRPFTLSGRLTAYPPSGGAPVFDVTLTGRGAASLTMALEDGRYSFSSLHYDFSVEPVPEPATVMLVGTGAALIWRRKRHRRAPS